MFNKAVIFFSSSSINEKELLLGSTAQEDKNNTNETRGKIILRIKIILKFEFFESVALFQKTKHTDKNQPEDVLG